MKSIKHYITEKFIINQNTKKIEIDPYDPTHWQVGEIVCCIAGYSMCLPRFYKITRRTPKGFVVKKMSGKIVSGHKNGQWKEIADEHSPLGEEFKGRILQHGSSMIVKIDGHQVHLWDGNPLHGDDQD